MNYTKIEGINLFNHDSIEVMKRMIEKNIIVDMIATDPPYHCFDKDTKVKTKRGFLYFYELKENDEILSVDINTMELKYTRIKRYIEREVCENLIQFKSKNMDLLVTDEHRMVAQRQHWGNRKQWNIIKEDEGLIFAKNISKSYTMPRRGYNFKGNTISHFTLPSIDLELHSGGYNYSEKKIDIKHWLRFFGFWLADGHVRGSCSNPKKPKYSISISQKIGNNEKFIDDLFDNLPFTYSKNYEENKGKVVYTIYDKQLWNYMKDFGNSFEKFVPLWIKELNNELLLEFYDSYKLGDLTKHGNSLAVSTVSKTMIEDFWEIELKLGFLANIRKTSNLYSFNIPQEKTMSYCYYPEIIQKHYNGKIYCVELEENNIMFVNRNGRCAVVGNCTARGCAGNSGGMLQKDINKKGQVFENNNIDIETWLPLCYQLLRDTGHCYIMTNHKNLHHYLNVAEEVGFHFTKSLIWDKGNKIMGQYYMSQFEYILFFRKGAGVKINNCGTSDLISIPNKKTKDENGENLHDTEKPVELMKILIENSSKEGEIVLDPFMGVGATCIASKILNRQCYGMEIDENYFNIVLKRLDNI